MAKAWANKADDHSKAWGKLSEKRSLSEPHFRDANAALYFGNKKPPAPEGGGKCRITISSAGQRVNKKASNSY